MTHTQNTSGVFKLFLSDPIATAGTQCCGQLTAQRIKHLVVVCVCVCVCVCVFVCVPCVYVCICV